jgi:hypothetical protein
LSRWIGHDRACSIGRFGSGPRPLALISQKRRL